VGRPIAADRPIREERKVVTALFADVVGSTALGERFDPEDVTEIVGRAVGRMVEAVEELGGTIKDLAGDGVLALFGAPDAHEDDPERAVRAGIQIVEAVRAHAAEVRREWGIEDLGVRVGIETGLVVLGAVGGGSRVEYGATGDAINTAARLQAHAESYAVLVGPTTHRLTEAIFRWGGPRELLLKGKAAPVWAFEVAGLRARPGRVRGMAQVDTPLLGRVAELRSARALGEALLQGHGGVLFVVGEPGIGKSRLLAELRDVLHAAGPVTWLEGRCVSYGEALPYWPFRDLLRGWIGATVVDAPGRVGDALRTRVGAIFGGRSEEVRPYLASVLGLPPDPSDELEALSAEARQFRTIEAVRALITRLAEDGPVVVAMEDLHWADAASLGLVERLLPMSETSRVLFVVTQRPEPDHPSWPLRDEARERLDGVRVLALEGLPAGTDRELLEALVGPDTLPDDVARRLVETAEGNPLYLEELVRSLIDAGAVVADNDAWRFEPGVAVTLPPTVERLIISRIDRLSPPARQAIQAASVLGRQFGRDLLETVAGDGTLSGAVTELLRADLLREDASSQLRFRHALIQEAAYNNTLKRHRRTLHARAAEALEAMLEGHLESAFGVLAQHHAGAGHLQEALGYFELAAADAQRIYAVEAALEHYTAALEIAEALATDRIGPLLLRRGRVRAQAGRVAEAREDLERASAAARDSLDRALEVESATELGFLLAGAVSYEEALPLLERSLATAQEMGLREAEVAAASRLSIVYTNLLRLDLAVDRAGRAWALAEAIEDEGALAMAMDAMQVASVMVGDMATVEDVSRRLVEMHTRRGDLWYLQVTLYQWAWMDIAAGRWDAGWERLSEALAVNRRIGDRANEPNFSTTLSWIARSRGEYGRAIELGRRGVELAGEVGHPEFRAWGAQQLGWTMLELFAVPEAMEHLERSVGAARESGGRIEMVRGTCHLPLARFLAGDRERALDEAATAERLLAEITAPPSRAYLQGADGPIALGELYVLADDPGRAAGLVRPLLDAALQAEWHEVVARSALVLGRASARLGDPAGAQELFDTVLERTDRVGMPGVAWRAHAELAALGPSGERAPHEARARELVDALAGSIEDESIRRTFLAGTDAALSGRGTG
jgi:class 3 adenylate cyclase